MTNTPIQGSQAETIIAEVGCFLLMKRGLFYRPNNCGYTGIKDYAGRYFASDASPDHGIFAVHEDDAPDFSPACYDDLARDHLQSKLAKANAEAAILRKALETIAGPPEYGSDGISVPGPRWVAAQCRDIARQALAQAIEARRAETGTGSVHESAVGGNADAPGA